VLAPFSASEPGFETIGSGSAWCGGRASEPPCGARAPRPPAPRWDPRRDAGQAYRHSPVVQISEGVQVSSRSLRSRRFLPPGSKTRPEIGGSVLEWWRPGK
jgi:hypothetical protein